MSFASGEQRLWHRREDRIHFGPDSRFGSDIAVDEPRLFARQLDLHRPQPLKVAERRLEAVIVSQKFHVPEVNCKASRNNRKSAEGIDRWRSVEMMTPSLVRYNQIKLSVGGRITVWLVYKFWSNSLTSYKKQDIFLFWSHTVWLNWRPPAEQWSSDPSPNGECSLVIPIVVVTIIYLLLNISNICTFSVISWIFAIYLRHVKFLRNYVILCFLKVVGGYVFIFC